MAKIDFVPGDVIVKDAVGGKQLRWTVQDPPRTSRGKLRLMPDHATTLLTTWWSHPSTGYRLPKRYRLEERNEHEQ